MCDEDGAFLPEVFDPDGPDVDDDERFIEFEARVDWEIK